MLFPGLVPLEKIYGYLANTIAYNLLFELLVLCGVPNLGSEPLCCEKQLRGDSDFILILSFNCLCRTYIHFLLVVYLQLWHSFNHVIMCNDHLVLSH